MVEKFKTIISDLNEAKVKVSLLALLKMDDLTDRWSVILSGPELANESKRVSAFQTLAGSIIKNLDKSEVTSIARVGVFDEDNHLVKDLLKFRKDTEINGQTKVNGNIVHAGYILESKGN